MKNYIEMYSKMILELDLNILKEQKARFENDIQHLDVPHPHQLEIIEMLDKRITELEIN